MLEILKKLRPEHFNYEGESTHALTVLYGILCPKDNIDMLELEFNKLEITSLKRLSRCCSKCFFSCFLDTLLFKDYKQSIYLKT